jgi:hypothetical protein
LTNRGFVELHNPTGFYLVGLGFLLVTLIVVAGGIFAMMIEREQVERRRQMRDAQQPGAAEAVVDLSRAMELTTEPGERSEHEADGDAGPKAESEPMVESEHGPDHPHEPA